ncbi:helix-turn-helix domain-containing protein [Patulibacter sp.]|uniref:helix-turn-helix domain-containing protein n=1 Tax=Patulibacter sp. TaxID=1912859 RepID=UPI002721019C|nr:helix-turn-helix domain-containing protein [Patulibacter sp.]MDO9409207.1 helix-turn-helix domain-containing protein [Patulibacter sp.]
MSDFLTEKRDEIQARLDELAPLIAEHDRLRRALDALDGVDSSGGSSSRQSEKSGGTRSAGRPRGSGERSRQALALLRQEPGLGAAEVARRIGVHPNYAYRILPGLEEQGLIEKKERLWYPKDAA